MNVSASAVGRLPRGDAPMRRDTLTVQARYVFPVEGPPIEDGCLTIDSGRIAWVGPSDERQGDLDLGNVAIVPGFVNAHTHLELAPLEQLGRPRTTKNEIPWLRRVIDQRRARTEQSLNEAVARNVKASIEAGTTFLADTTTAGLSWGPIAEAPAACRGLRRADRPEARPRARDQRIGLEMAGVDPPRDPGGRLRPAGPEPARALQHVGLALSQGRRQPDCRSRPTWPRCPRSCACSNTATARCASFLEELGAWDDDWEPIGPRPADYVRRGELRNADWLIAHGTYLEPDDFWQLRPEAAPDGHRVAVAFCPRTHARFGHAPHPYRALLERGVIVCLGTDSLASAPSLSILDEMRFLHRRDESLSGELLADHGHPLRRLGPSRRDHHRQPEARQVGRPGHRRPSRPRRGRPLRTPPRIRPARRRHGLRGGFRGRTVDGELSDASPSNRATRFVAATSPAG